MKTIIFDFGNVVGFFDHGLTLDRLAAHTDMPTEEMFDILYRGTLEIDIETGRLSRDEWLGRVHRLWRLRCELDFLAASIADIFTPNPEVCGLIPLLRPRYRVLLGSNTNAVHAPHFRRQFADVFAHFDHLVFSHEIGHRKPQPGFYAHCQQLARCEPGAVVFVDDLPANIEAARAVGWNGVLYRPDDDLAGKLRRLGVAI